ncbi:MAG: threonine synthase [Anaerolineae bacterium]|nr:threonine synthase [Anaerolineae bacterium]
MAVISELRCTLCNHAYQPGEVKYFCPECGQVGTLDVLYDYKALRDHLDRDALTHNREPSMWRYRELLPVAPETPVPPLQVGYTPLLAAPRVAAALGLGQVWVKDDGQNPTASLKDRASTMVVARAIENNIRIVSTASTGNAAAALSGICASVPDMRAIIFVPVTAPEAKIAQLLVYGATVLLVEATYDTAFDLCYELSQSEGWYCRNTGINPFTTEGKKTVAYEIAEQLGWQVPDVVVVSVGDGSIIGGVHKGFWELHQLGWIERIPRLIGVQASGSSALVYAWENNLPAQAMQPRPAETIADSISAGLPRDRAKALRAVRQSGGALVAVEDDAILDAIPRLARASGVFAEPAAAAVYAGAQRAVQSKWIAPDERVVLLVTGNGLKDVRAAQRSVSGGIRVPPDAEIIRQLLDHG